MTDKATKHHIRVQRHARYYQYNHPGEHINELWFVLHGYGHSGGHFISKFKNFRQPDRLIIAPEGLSRFYFEGLDGSVGASWMTKESRLEEIQDYVEYLSDLKDSITSELRADIRFRVVGFSQGCATSSRWIASLPQEQWPDHFFVVCGEIPMDVPAEKLLAMFQQMQIHLIFQKDDHFITEEALMERKKILDASGLPHSFELLESGGHEITKEVLELMANELDRS